MACDEAKQLASRQIYELCVKAKSNEYLALQKVVRVKKAFESLLKGMRNEDSLSVKDVRVALREVDRD